ncbi:hypothetical protein TRIP_C21399 [Candidatus Zixiibacteriota bacterium]|nr:hypothetical protein TRIP_C21399 [candidate division Zixibacteria bacterium]
MGLSHRKRVKWFIHLISYLLISKGVTEL